MPARTQPKHREISRQLASEIAVGKYGPGGKLPSEAALVARFGVSRPTVARALRDLAAEDLIERRAGSGTYLKRTAPPPPPARELGLLVPERRSIEIFEQICGELSRIARAQDHVLLYGGSSQPPLEGAIDREHALAMTDLFIKRRVSGVLFAPFESIDDHAQINAAITDRLNKAGIPVVLLDRDLVPFPRRSGFDLVGLDNVAGGFIAAEHVAKLGCKKIAFLKAPSAAPTSEARIAGAREALARHGLAAADGWVKEGDPDNAAFVRDTFVGRGWDAILCTNDLIAARLERSLSRNGVQVPRDVRLIGFDDTQYASIVRVPLTTISQPYRDLAWVAFRALSARIADPTLPVRSILLPPRLIVRESCGAYEPPP